MGEKTNHRRKFLGAVATTTAAGAAMPQQWLKPVINSVVIPVHAQTSQLLCSTGPLTIDDSGNSPFGLNDSIAIIFDGDTCRLEEIEDDDCGGTCDPDTMLVVDNDSDNPPSGNFDLNSPFGTNWDDTPDVDDLPAGTHEFTKTRVGGANNGSSYTVRFTVSFGTGAGSQETSMTVSDVQFFPA